MATLPHSLRDPGDGNIFGGQGQEPQLNLVAKLLPDGDVFQISQPR